MTPSTARLAEVATDVLPGQVQLLRDLIACRAVSTQLPDEAFVSESERAIDLIERALAPLQFVTQRWRTAGGFPVLCARRDVPSRASTVGFNGHLDVVPIEDPAKWRHDPWGGAQVESRLYGRGACDAKGAVVAMTGALQLLAAAGVEPVTHLLPPHRHR